MWGPPEDLVLFETDHASGRFLSAIASGQVISVGEGSTSGRQIPPNAENDKTVSMAPLGLLNEDVKTADSHIDGIDIGCFTQSGS